MPKNKLKILHLRGRNGSEYGRVGLYSGNELPKEYRGVGKLFADNPGISEITVISPDHSSKRFTGYGTDEDVFKRYKPVMCNTFVEGEGWGPHEVDIAEDIKNAALAIRKLNNGEAM